MKIVTLFESLKIGGGVEKVQATIGTGLFEQWHEVIYLVMQDKVPRNEYKWTIVSLDEPFIFGFWVNKIFSLFRIGKRVAKFCKNEKVDVILGQWDFFYMVVAVSKWINGNPAKCVGVVHTTISIWSGFIKQVLIFLLKKLDHIVLISKAEQQTFIQEYGFPEEKCTIIYNSIDEKEINTKKDIPLSEEYQSLFQEGKYTFINIGRLTYQKNQSLLLRAFEMVHKKHPNTQLIILWGGELQKDLEKEKESLSSSLDIHLLGNQTNIYHFLKVSDCFVLSSRFEGFPMVLIEVAMLGGIPVVSTDCPTGPNELIPIEYLSSINIPELLAENMSRIITDSIYQTRSISVLQEKRDLFLSWAIKGRWDHLVETLSS
jgi:glycosyltransferase involved in cell wall biosynthesis